MKKIGLFILSLLIFLSGATTVKAQERLLEILRQELRAHMQELQQKDYPPYYMNYRVVDETNQILRASFGVMMGNHKSHTRTFVPQIRLGNADCDNFRDQDMGGKPGGKGITAGQLPLEDVENAIRQSVWDEVCSRYDNAVDNYLKMQVNVQLNLATQDSSPCLAATPVEKYYEAPLPAHSFSIDETLWAGRLKEISGVLKRYPDLQEGNAVLSHRIARTYFLSSEGTEIVHNLRYARLMVTGKTTADDGMQLPLALSYFAFEVKDLPDQETILKDVEKMAQTLTALKNAPVAEPYTGPVILAGEASGVFFHEIFGHRVEGQRMRNELDGQTFKKMIGQLVLPEHTQVYDDPVLRQYRGQDLNGYYKYDEQGVKAERVQVVADGKMNDFLMTRKTMNGFPKSNGHARAMGGFDPVSRQSNLIIESGNLLTENELRNILLEEIKAQKKEYGYFFKAVNGGFTLTDARAINSFNVTPLEVYRVYPDGRPDELVRGVDIVGTPLTMFSSISHFGGEPKVFTGMCGAESGWIPVTAISPSIMVKKVETQLKAKSNILPPLTPKPRAENN